MNLHYSQTDMYSNIHENSFTTLWIYTILKLKKMSAAEINGFTTLWIYTILKQVLQAVKEAAGFTTLWIYTILKLYKVYFRDWAVSLPYEFTLFSNGQKQ